LDTIWIPFYNLTMFKFLRKSKSKQDVEKPQVPAKSIADEIDVKSKQNLKRLEFEKKIIPLTGWSKYFIDNRRISNEKSKEINDKDLDIFFETQFQQYKNFFTKAFLPNGNHFQIKFDDDALFWKVFWNRQEELFIKLFDLRPDLFEYFTSSFDIKKTETGINLGVKPCFGLCTSHKGELKYLFITNTEFYNDPEYKVYKCEFSGFGYHLTKSRELN